MDELNQNEAKEQKDASIEKANVTEENAEEAEAVTGEMESETISPLPVPPSAVISPSIPLVAMPVIQNEEYATELAEPGGQISHSAGDAEPKDRTWGWISLAVSILSLFILPLIMGSAGAILGVIAVFKGIRTLGGWSIAISLVSLFTALIIMPYFV